MTTSYTALELKAATLLSKYGLAWTIRRNGQTIGRLNGIKTKAETSNVRNGLTLSANKVVELILEATPLVKVGDVLSSNGGSYIVATVNKVEPAGTTVVQKITAA